jgi:2',3'-cyclic-nucleotide 2'-phosphodiesterase (5'-nucleotidase family)
VHVDLGDFLAAEETVGHMKNRFIWQTMEQTGCQISVPGIRELTDWQQYRELLTDGQIHPVLSNVTVLQDGVEKPVGLPTYVVDVGGVRVGFFALMGANELTTAKPVGGVEFRSQDVMATAQRTSQAGRGRRSGLPDVRAGDGEPPPRCLRNRCHPLRTQSRL